MLRILSAVLVSIWLVQAPIGSTLGQGKQPPPPVQPQDPAPPAEKAKEPEPYARDGSQQIVYYALAGIGAILVMVLVCMPARRE